MAGRNLTEYMIKLLTRRGYQFTTSAEREIVRDMKEKLCYVSENYENEKLKDPNIFEKTYTLPDGQVLSIGDERFTCPESLFKPSMVGLTSAGIHQNVYTSIMQSDIDVRRNLYSNIVLSGGSTMFPGWYYSIISNCALATSLWDSAAHVFDSMRKIYEKPAQ